MEIKLGSFKSKRVNMIEKNLSATLTTVQHVLCTEMESPPVEFRLTLSSVHVMFSKLDVDIRPGYGLGIFELGKYSLKSPRCV
jgi:hypothetical protein